MSGSNEKRRRIAAEKLMTDMSNVFIKHMRGGLTLLEMCGYAMGMLANVIAKKYGAEAARLTLLSLAEQAEKIEQITDDQALASFLAQAKPKGRA